MMANVGEKLAALEQRVRRLEDELEIRDMFVCYGMAADTGDAPRLAAMFTEDGVYDVGDSGELMDGREAVHGMILGESHQSRLPNLGHTVGPLALKFDGDKAVAYGYSRTYLKTGDQVGTWRLAYNRINLERHDGRWQMKRRTNLMVGSEEAQEIFRDGLKNLPQTGRVQ